MGMHSGHGKFAGMEVIQVTVAMRNLDLTRPKCQEGTRAGDRNLGAIGIRIIFQVTGLV